MAEEALLPQLDAALLHLIVLRGVTENEGLEYCDGGRGVVV